MKQTCIGIGIGTKEEKQTHQWNIIEHAQTFTVYLCHLTVSLFSENGYVTHKTSQVKSREKRPARFQMSSR